MIVYLDSSVVLRRVLRQSEPLREWDQIERGVSSALLRVECARAVDRLRLGATLDPAELQQAQTSLFQVLDSIETAAIDTAVVQRASYPMPIVLRSLDAIHL